MIWWMIACIGTEKIPEPSIAEPEAEPESLPAVEEEEIGNVDLDTSASTQGRKKKRMSVAQVRDSMERITETTWGNNTSKWDSYADSLGVPDYQQRMSPDLSPSVIFQKFLNDAAAESCAEWLEASSDIFLHDPLSSELSEIQQNIDLLRWRIQGHAQGSIDPILHDYLDLYQSVWVRTDDSMMAWHTVCVGMFTHPDFWMY